MPPPPPLPPDPLIRSGLEVAAQIARKGGPIFGVRAPSDDLRVVVERDLRGDLYMRPPDELGDEIHGGSQGTVYKAPGGLAIKRIRNCRTPTDVARALVHECAVPWLVGQLVDGIVRVHGWTVLGNGDPAVVMERIRGPSLADMTAEVQECMPPAGREVLARRLAWRLSLIVRRLRDIGAGHCDLHDGNVMFRRPGYPCAPDEIWPTVRSVAVIDFGFGGDFGPQGPCTEGTDWLQIAHIANELVGEDNGSELFEEVRDAIKREAGVAEALEAWIEGRREPTAKRRCVRWKGAAGGGRHSLA